MNIGICIPSVCSNDIVKNGLSYAVPFLNNLALPIEFADVEGVKAVKAEKGSKN